MVFQLSLVSVKNGLRSVERVRSVPCSFVTLIFIALCSCWSSTTIRFAPTSTRFTLRTRDLGARFYRPCVARAVNSRLKKGVPLP